MIVPQSCLSANATALQRPQTHVIFRMTSGRPPPFFNATPKILARSVDDNVNTDELLVRVNRGGEGGGCLT